jgi:hypothetical protein
MMIATLEETLREDRTRRSCLAGIVLVGVVELGRLLLMPQNWSGTLLPLATLRTVVTVLFLVSFFPPSSLRKLRYIIFYVSVGLVASERVVWTFADALGAIKTPSWSYAINATLIVLISGSLLFGEKNTNHRSATATAMMAVLSFLLLVYAFS